MFLYAAKKKPMAGLLERRNVHFETPLSDQNAVSGLLNSNSCNNSNNSNNNGGVPPSPNTRRRAFNFTPISPRLTPDVPASPGSTGQLRQLLSTCTGGGGTNSPFVSPRQTPVPSSLPPSQPHSRHNSGHMVNIYYFKTIDGLTEKENIHYITSNVNLYKYTFTLCVLDILDFGWFNVTEIDSCWMNIFYSIVTTFIHYLCL